MVEPSPKPGPESAHARIAVQHEGKTLATVVRDLLGGIPWSRARALCKRGKVSVDGQRWTDPARRVSRGQQVRVDAAAPRVRPGVLESTDVLHVDPHVLVVNKPRALLSVPFDATDRDTLVDRAQAWLRRGRGARGQGAPLGVVQRLDKDTTGVLVFARTVAARRALQTQFRAHSIERRYLALAHGAVAPATHESLLIQDRGDGLRGSFGLFRSAHGRPAPEDARRAVTHVRPLEALRGATLVECRLETGRQHQIRIHLSEAGHPLLGEAVYIRDYRGQRIRSPRPMLHAAVLGFEHPATGEPMRFELEPPGDFRAQLQSLRA